jgi:hypothetical protein
MKDDRTRILIACERFMIPIAKMMLSLGVGHKEFSEVTKRAFVGVATRDYGLRGRPTNTSRVAVLTGLTRKEVKRVKESLTTDLGVDSKMGPASTVLHFWHKDAIFLDKKGIPLDLSIDGPNNSFAHLAKLYGGDVPPGALLLELERTGAVVRTPQGKLKVTTRYFLPSDGIERFVSAVSLSLENLAYTASQNILDTKNENPLLERFVWSDRIDEKTAKRFKLTAKQKTIDLLEYLDDWIAANEISEPTESRIGLGIYIIDGPK